MIWAEIEKEVADLYNLLINSLPSGGEVFLNLFLIAVLILVYSIFIWKLYKFIARRDILELNLAQYNKLEHSLWAKLLAGFFYFLEYIIILPFLLFFWFGVFAFFILMLSTREVSQILLISAAVIAAIRMTAYYSQDLSKDLAKMVPFTLLGIFLLTPGFFDIPRIINSLAKIPSFLNHILFYLMFIFILELILRFFDFIFRLFGTESDSK